jgi:hypothetical protein
MHEESFEALYTVLVQAYIRLQAKEVLGLCLKTGKTQPLQNLVEKLVLAGPASLSALREILAEVEYRQSELNQNSGFTSQRPDKDNTPLLRDLVLLGEIQFYLQDWFWSLIYMDARQERPNLSVFPTKVKYLQ